MAKKKTPTKKQRWDALTKQLEILGLEAQLAHNAYVDRPHSLTSAQTRKLKEAATRARKMYRQWWDYMEKKAGVGGMMKKAARQRWRKNPLRDLPRAGARPHEFQKFIKDKKGYIMVTLTGYSGYAIVSASLINKKQTGGPGAAFSKGTKVHRIGSRSYQTWNGAVTRYRNLTSPTRIKKFFGENRYEAARRKVFPKKRGRKPAAKGRRYKRWTLPPLSAAELKTGDHGNVMYYIYELEHKPTSIAGYGGSPKSALEDLKKNLDFEFGTQRTPR